MTTTAALTAVRSRYAGNAIATASAPTLLVMLYDRLVQDLLRAEQALTDRQLDLANRELQHAQQIILELRASLDTTVWSGAAGLEQLYTWLHSELLRGNVEKDPARVLACRLLVEPLRDAWRQAASTLS